MNRGPQTKIRRISAIKGTKDILPQDAREWQNMEAASRALFELYGYREIRTPVFEATELFEKGTGSTSDIVTKEMYTFTDKGGRSLTLRPEYTPSVVRAIIDNSLHLKPQPMRFYFMGPMFRYDKPQKGRYRQFHQIDVEVFGEEDPAIDAELVEMADSLLRRLGVTGTEVLVNSVGCRQCRPGYLKNLRKMAGEAKSQLCADCRRKVTTNPLRIFDCKQPSCREVSQSFPRITDNLCPECRDHFQRFCVHLDFFGIPYRVEPRLVRGIDYYTKTTFEVISSHLGAQDAILGGGRYDDMMKNFGGPNICGIGFAVGMERLLSVVPYEPPRERFLYIAHMGVEAQRAGMALARFFRREGVECLIDYRSRSFKNQLARASKLGAAWVLVVGEDEVKSGRFQLKDMASTVQKPGTREEILARIRKSS